MGTVPDYLLSQIWTVSELSLFDRAVLSAQFYYYYDERMNCARAISEETKKTKRYAEAVSRARLRFGCNTISAKPKVEIDGVSFYTCLCNFKHPLFDLYLELSERLEQGILPETGSILDQSARTMEALRLLRRLKIEAQVQEQKEANIKSNKKHGR